MSTRRRRTPKTRSAFQPDPSYSQYAGSPNAGISAQIITAKVGRERKERFAEYCRQHKTTMSRMILQLIDFAMK